MVNSRNKGARGERECVDFFKDMGFDAKRTAQLQAANDDSQYPDVTARRGDLSLGIECKVGNTVVPAIIYRHIKQAEDEAGQRIPLVYLRRDREDAIIIMTAAVFKDWI